MFTVIIVVCSLKSMCVPNFIVIGYCVSGLHGHYCNILPEAVYCCYTRTTLFTKYFTCLYDQSLRLLSYHQALLLYTLCFLRYNIACILEAVYCCFTNVYCCYCGVFTEKYVLTEFHLDWLLCE